METLGGPSGSKPKKAFSIFKLVLYLFALLGAVWFGFQAYWEYFKLKLWLSGFGNGVFWTAGLSTGFVYFYAAHKIHERIKVLQPKEGRAGAYALFCAGLVLLDPLTLSLASWIFSPPGELKNVSLWFLEGCAIGSGIVLLLERLFVKKDTKP